MVNCTVKKKEGWKEGSKDRWFSFVHPSLFPNFAFQSHRDVYCSLERVSTGTVLSDSWNNSPSKEASKREHRTRRGYLFDQFFNRNFFRNFLRIFASSFFKRDKWRDHPHAMLCPNTIPFSIRNNVVSLIASFHNLSELILMGTLYPKRYEFILIADT